MTLRKKLPLSVSAFRNFCLYMRRNVLFKSWRLMKSTLIISSSTNCCFPRHVILPLASFFPCSTNLLQLRIANIAMYAGKCNKSILQRLTSFTTSFSTLSSFRCSQRRSEVQRNSKNLARCWLNHMCPPRISLYSAQLPMDVWNRGLGLSGRV